MMVMLAPVVNSTGQRKNKGAVNLVMEPSYEDKATGRLVPTKRVRVGLEPVDVSGCKDPMLKKFLASGKLVRANQESLEAAEEAQALEDESKDQAGREHGEGPGSAETAKSAKKKKGKGFFDGKGKDK